MAVRGLDDLVLEFNQIYSKGRTMGKKGKDIFSGIIADLFSKYGERLGYSDINLFQSDLIITKSNMRKTKKSVIKNCFRKIFFGDGEGDGQGFTKSQIEKYGLDGDSY